MDAFCSMLMHNAHTSKSATNEPTPYVYNCQHVTEDFSKKDVHTITTNKKVIASICWSSSHFVVVEVCLDERNIYVYDGLNRSLDSWVPHVVHMLKKFEPIKKVQKEEVNIEPS